MHIPLACWGFYWDSILKSKIKHHGLRIRAQVIHKSRHACRLIPAPENAKINPAWKDQVFLEASLARRDMENSNTGRRTLSKRDPKSSGR